MQIDPTTQCFTGRQLRAARALVDIEQIELANRAGVSVGTIRRMETFNGPVQGYHDTIVKVEKALEKLGVMFICDEDGWPGVQLKAIRGSKRKSWPVYRLII